MKIGKNDIGHVGAGVKKEKVVRCEKSDERIP